jgi:MFS transporter, FHS family, glucose/mannose:H+ symporter
MRLAPEIPPTAAAESPGNDPGTLAAGSPLKALAGFFVSGILLAFLGAILPSWGHHLQSDYWMIGLYFVALILGVLASVRIAPPLIQRKGLAWTLAGACALASLALLYLAFFSPPYGAWWRLPGILLLGGAAGLLHTAIFHAISPMYRHDPAATVNLGGILFGLGCFSVAFLISQAFYFYTAAAIQIWIALIPAFFAMVYARTRFAPYAASAGPSARAVLAEMKSPGAVLFSLVLFFQFGNEWAIAGWLPLFLSQRLGMSPADSVLILALYWMALLVGRLVAQWILPRVRHTRLLVLSVLLAMFACMILLDTNNGFGAVSGVLLLGAAFAPIYPLVVEKIGHRFPYYHPGFYNGIFSFAMVGGLLAPCTLGYFAWLLDVRAVMGLPLVGSVIVFVLLALIWLEVRLSALLHPSDAS